MREDKNRSAGRDSRGEAPARSGLGTSPSATFSLWTFLVVFRSAFIGAAMVRGFPLPSPWIPASAGITRPADLTGATYPGSDSGTGFRTIDIMHCQQYDIGGATKLGALVARSNICDDEEWVGTER